jgi:hypothetical protein
MVCMQSILIYFLLHLVFETDKPKNFIPAERVSQ